MRGRGNSELSVEHNPDRRRRERIELWRLRRPRSVPVSRVFCHAERSLWAAKPHEGASEQAVGTCCLISAVASRKAPSSPNDCRSPMWNMGAVKRICGSKSKTPYQRPSGQLIDRYTVNFLQLKKRAERCNLMNLQSLFLPKGTGKFFSKS